ncbi:hypothetical protein [Methanosarcina sp. UBA5]|uniref:hypothetical protein n=1 Tax=Methanosarcina sp. UBA5 TaxID=1915593 RepID=UPI0025D454F9|nr:hypothetical protein [Methanosarcina sp. UBA5]
MPSVLFVIISSIIFLPLIPEMNTKSIDNSSLSSAGVNNSTKETFLPYKLQTLWEDKLGLLSFTSFTLSIFLLLFNRPMIKMLEGYYLLFVPGISYFERRKLRRLNKSLESTRSKLNKINYKDKYSELNAKITELSIRLNTEFPFALEYILPTSFGNAIRSFELYSYKVYGIDATSCWPRIISFASESHRTNINDASSRVDFAVNCLYLTTVIIFELILIYSLEIIPQITFIISESFTIFVLICLWKYAIMSAKLWGDEVKSVFDLYRYDLITKLNGLNEITLENIPRNEKEYWYSVDNVFLYHTKWENVIKKDEETPKI